MSIQQEKLKAIADAIREKDGTTGIIIANDFPARIRAIPTAPENLRTITLQATPIGAGNVVGSGHVLDGMTITVKAIANTGYNFNKWMIGSTVASSSPTYTFAINSNVNLVAVFN